MKKTFLIIATIFAFTTSNSALAAIKQYNITIKDHKFEPTIIEVPAHTKFKLIVTNLDKTAEEFESDDLHKEKIISAGNSAKILVKPLKPGEYEFVGEFHEDTAQGKIIVK